MGILYFAVMIGVLVFVHEYGHYVASRMCGVAVTEFSIGFGPRIAGFKRRGTNFVISLLPLGGYVMNAHSQEEADRAGNGVALPAAPLRHRAWIAFAGPLFSFLLAIPCYFAVGLGTDEMPAPVVAHITDAASPAARAGLQPGDEIVAVDGRAVTYWHQMQDAIQGHTGDGPIALEVRRGEDAQTVQVVPERVDGLGPRIGISYVPVNEAGEPQVDAVITRDFPFGERLPYAATHAVTEPFEISGRVVGAIAGMFTGSVSTKQLGGPVMIFNAASDAGQAGWERFVLLMAIITINLALINLLPIPILDGGKLVLIAIEGVQRRPLSARTQQITAMVGMAMVIALMVLAFKNDLERYWSSWFG